MEAPERIYLQMGLEEWDDDPELTWDDLEKVTWLTWHINRINDSDVEYVRRDIAAKLREALGFAYGRKGYPRINNIAELLDETAWLADEGEATADD